MVQLAKYIGVTLLVGGALVYFAFVCYGVWLVIRYDRQREFTEFGYRSVTFSVTNSQSPLITEEFRQAYRVYEKGLRYALFAVFPGFFLSFTAYSIAPTPKHPNLQEALEKARLSNTCADIEEKYFRGKWTFTCRKMKTE